MNSIKEELTEIYVEVADFFKQNPELARKRRSNNDKPKMEDGAAIDEKRKTVNVDLGDINSIEKQASDLAGALVGHFLAEGLEIGKGNFNFIDEEKILPNGKVQLVKRGAHTVGLEADSKILSGYTGRQEGIRTETQNKYPNGGVIYQFIYTSVQFDVYYKSDPTNPNDTLIQVDRKPRK